MEPDWTLRERLHEICGRAGFEASDLQINQLSAYLLTLRRWNSTINLTSLELEGFPGPSLQRLIAEPLEASVIVSSRLGPWFDLGSGSGSPALPIKIVLPDFALTMVESRGRKVAFLREAARQSGLAGVDVISGRIEDLPTVCQPGSATLLSVRGVRIDQAVADAIRQMLAPSGEVLLIGSDEWSGLAADFDCVTRRGSARILRRRVPRGTHS